MLGVSELRAKRLLWQGVAVCLVLAAIAGVTLWRAWLPERISAGGYWGFVSLAWLGHYLLFTLKSRHGAHFETASTVLWVANPILAFLGGGLYLVVLWGALVLLLWAAQDYVFGWASIGERPPDLDL